MAVGPAWDVQAVRFQANLSATTALEVVRAPRYSPYHLRWVNYGTICLDENNQPNPGCQRAYIPATNSIRTGNVCGTAPCYTLTGTLAGQQWRLNVNSPRNIYFNNGADVPGQNNYSLRVQGAEAARINAIGKLPMYVIPILAEDAAN